MELWNATISSKGHVHRVSCFLRQCQWQVRILFVQYLNYLHFKDGQSSEILKTESTFPIIPTALLILCWFQLVYNTGPHVNLNLKWTINYIFLNWSRGQVASPLSSFCPLHWQNLDLSWSSWTVVTLRARWPPLCPPFVLYIGKTWSSWLFCQKI